MIIRPARAEDLSALATIARSSYRATFASILESEALARCDRAFFERRFAQAWPRMNLAEESGIAGFTLVTDFHLDMLFVDPARTGRGIGKALLDASGARTLECFAANRGARRFYEREGWVLTSSYERDYLGRMRGFVTYRAPTTGSR